MATACLQRAHDECIASAPLACHPPCMDPRYLTLASVAVLAWRALGKRQPLRPQLPYTKRVSPLNAVEPFRLPIGSHCAGIARRRLTGPSAATVCYAEREGSHCSPPGLARWLAAAAAHRPNFFVGVPRRGHGGRGLGGRKS